MAGITALFGILGTGLQVMGAIQQGKYQEAAYELEARQREAAAKEERAAGQRDMLEKRREYGRLASRQRAVAAASGTDVQSPGVLDIFEDTAARSQYEEGVARYRGEARARGELDKAAAARFRGKAAKKSSFFDAAAAGIQGLGNLYG